MRRRLRNERRLYDRQPAKGAPMNRIIARFAIAILVVPFMLGCNAITGLFTGPSDTEYRASGTAALVSLTHETEDAAE